MRFTKIGIIDYFKILSIIQANFAYDMRRDKNSQDFL